VRSQVRRLAWVFPASLALLLTASGCGFANALAHPAPAPVEPSDEPPQAAPTTSADRTVVQADLQGSNGVATPLTVTVGPVVTGLVPPVPNFHETCPVDGPSLQYLTVSIAFPAGTLAGHLTVRKGPSTPADAGDVGVFFESGNGAELPCASYPPLPTTDTFWNQMNAASITGYVVLDRAVTAATPEGRPGVFPTLQLELSDLRVLGASGRTQRLTPLTPSVGSICPGDPTAICLSLG
jgi:hypothetical protein